MIAVSSGQGKLLRVSLELVDSCMDTSSSDVPLAVADADVFVKIQNQVNKLVCLNARTDFIFLIIHRQSPVKSPDLKT